MKKLTRTRSFWVYPNHRRTHHKFRCIITPTGKSLIRLAKQEHLSDPENTVAFCQSYRRVNFKKGKKGVLSGDMGNIVLPADEMFSEYIAHECAHAAHAYCRRLRKSNFRAPGTGKCHENEEVFCYAVGYMTQQIHNWIFKNGLGVLCCGKK